jgi:hypothetical protein
MGGFVDTDGRPIDTRKRLLQSGCLEQIKATSKAAIEDKSKGDAISKGIAFCQVSWFVVQGVARMAQNLPLTELEVTTLAYASINLFTWLFWWNKPFDVHDPIVVHSTSDDSEPSMTDVAITPQDSEDKGSSVAGLITPHASCLFGAVFGAIHCAAWNAHFPSTVEMWMWRVSAILLVTLPIMGLSYLIFCGLMGRLEEEGKLEEEGRVKFEIRETVIITILLSLLILYVIARLFLLVLPLTNLRSLPPNALMDVDWTRYIPHLYFLTDNPDKT